MRGLITGLTFALLSHICYTSSLCWDFEFSPGNVPEVCGDGTTSLNFVGNWVCKLGAPLCDYSGCFLSNGEGYFTQVPSTLVSTWTIMMWVFSTHSNQSVPLAIENVADVSDVMKLKTTATELAMQKGTDSQGITLAQDWTKQRWFAVYFFSSSQTYGGFGAYIPNLEGQSNIHEKAFNVDIGLDQYKGAGYRIRFGSASQGLNPISLVRKVQLHTLTSYHSSSSPSIRQNFQSNQLSLPIATSCPDFSLTDMFICTESWIHYEFNTAGLSSDQQEVQDASLNSNHGTNGLNTADNISDALLTSGGMEFQTSGGYIQVPPISSPHVSYSIVAQIMLLSQEPCVVYSETNFKFELLYPGIKMEYANQVIQGCFENAWAINSKYLLGIVINYISTTQLNVAIFIDDSMCLHTQITATFQTLTDLKIGEGFQGLFTRFSVFRAVMGLESFPNYKKTTCPPSQYFDVNAMVCAACASECFSCYGALSTQCIDSCPEGTFFYDNQCRACHPTCLECSDSDSDFCISCRPGLTLQSDNTCTCPEGQFFQTHSLTCQQCAPGCLTCQNAATICTTCEPGYPLGQYQDCLCPNFLVYNGQSCECGYIGPEGACQPCGNGSLDQGQQCDDGNDFDGDGCSSHCQIEPLFDCEAQPFPSVCSPMEFIAVKDIIQETNEQGITITLQLNSKVHIDNFSIQNLTIFHDFTQEPTITVEEINNQQVTELKFTINPLESIPPHSRTISFTLQSHGMKSDDSQLVVPQEMSRTVPVTQFDYVNPSIQTVSESFDHSMSSFTTGSVIGGIVGQILLNMSMEPLWVLINTNQLIFMIPLISVNFPLNSIVLFKVLSFANGDLLLFVIIYNSTVGKYISSSDSGPYHKNFEVLGYETMGLFDNAGIFYCLLLFQLFVLTVISISAKICCGSMASHCTRCMNRLCGSLIRTYYQVLLEIMLCSCLTIYNMNLDSLTAKLSYALACVSVLVGFIITQKLIVVTIRSISQLQNQNSKVYQRYKEVYQMLRMDGGFYPLQYFSWFILRRLILIVVILFLVGLPFLQIALHLFLGVLDLVFLATCKPFREKVDLVFNLFNSLALIVLYFVVLLLYIMEKNYPAREALGWTMIVLIIALNFTNMVSILTIKICETKQKCKNRRMKALKERYKMAKERCDESYSNSSTPSMLNKTALLERSQSKSGSSLFKRLKLPSLRRETSQVEQELREVK